MFKQWQNLPTYQQTIYKYYAFAFAKNFAFFSAVLVPFFTDWGGINQAQIQLLQSWFMGSMFLLEIPTGAVADYFGRKHSLVAGAFCCVAAALLYGSVANFGVFLAGEFLFAVAMALVSGADQALIYDALRQARKESLARRVFGRAHAFRMAGMLISAAIGSLMAQLWGLNSPMLMSAGSFFVAGLIALTFTEPPRTNGQTETTRYWQIAIQGTRYFLRHPQLRLLAFDSIMVGSAAYFIIWFYQPMLEHLGLSVGWFGSVHVVLVLAQMLVSANFHRLEQLLGSPKAFARWSAAFTAGGFFLAGMYPSFLTVGLFVILAGGFGLTRSEYLNAQMNSYIESDQRATVLSAVSMARKIILVVLNPIMGLIAMHSLPVGLFLLGLLPLVVALRSFVPDEFDRSER